MLNHGYVEVINEKFEDVFRGNFIVQLHSKCPLNLLRKILELLIPINFQLKAES